MPPRFRIATVEDAGELARGVIAGVADYPTFAGPDWAPPTVEHEVAYLHELLPRDDVWCLVAESDGRIAGQVTVLPAARAGRPTDEPGLAHLSNLHVAREHWGTGLATALHDRAVDHARQRGYHSLRLFVAAGQRRARRFYEREGWTPITGEFHEPDLNLVLVEYRRFSLDLHRPAE